MDSSSFANSPIATTAGTVAPTSWQPIETAPKNARVLVYLPTEDIGVGNWHSQISRYDDDWNAIDPQPFWRMDMDETGKYSRAHQPTHWMPLPEPPK